MDNDIDLGAALYEVVDAEFELMENPSVSMAMTPGSFDLATITLSLVPYEHHVALMSQEALSIIVTDPASQKLAVSAESRNKKLYKDLEVARKAAVAPYNEHVNQINRIFKTLTAPLAQNQATIKLARSKYEHQLELERRRRLAEQREEQRKLQARIDAEARNQRLEAERKAREAREALELEQDLERRAALEKEIEEETAAAAAPTPQVAPMVAEKPTVVRTAEGSSYTKFVWKCRVVAPDLVPRQYCEPATKLLDAAVRGGHRNIPGCEITEEAVPVTKV